MSAFERQQMFSALILLALALFVTAGYATTARWRPRLRIGSIVVFCIAVAWALVEIGLWLAASAR